MRQGRSFRQRMPTGTRTPTQRAIAVLRKYGTDAHIYLPGVGMLNGLQAGNYIDSALTTPAAIDNPVGGVVDAMGGINATQPTTSAKPILRRGAVNLLTYSGDFSNAAWGTLRASVSVNTVTATAASANGFSVSRNSITASSTVVTCAVELKRGSSSHAIITVFDGSVNGIRQWFDLDSGLVASSNFIGTGWSKVSASIALGADGKYLCSVVVSTQGTAVSAGIYPSAPADLGYACVIGEVGNIYAAALFQGTYTAQQIQALGGIPLTTTAPASTALGNTYWQFDGTNDALTSTGLPYAINDDHCLIAGATPNGAGRIFSIGGAGANFPEAGDIQTDGAGRYTFRWKDDTAAVVSQTTGITALGVSSVASLRKLGATRSSRLNAVQVGTSSAVLGAATVTQMGIGSFGPGGNHFNGNIYPVIAIKGTVTDPDLLLLEKLVGQLSGVTI